MSLYNTLAAGQAAYSEPSTRPVSAWRVSSTAESGELTPTLKRRRRVIVERYAREIEELYSVTADR